MTTNLIVAFVSNATVRGTSIRVARRDIQGPFLRGVGLFELGWQKGIDLEVPLTPSETRGSDCLFKCNFLISVNIVIMRFSVRF